MAWTAHLSAYMTKSAVVQSAKTEIGTGAEKRAVYVLKKKNKSLHSMSCRNKGHITCNYFKRLFT